MKLLVLAYEYPPIGGGTGQALERLLEAWPRAGGWEFELWTASPPPNRPRGKFGWLRYIEFPCLKRELHYWKTREQAILLWKVWRKTLGDDPLPDAVLVWGGWPLGILLLGALGEVPSILALRGSDVPGFNPRTSGLLWKNLARAIWRRSHIVTANSPALAALARRTAPSVPMEIIPNGVRSLPDRSEGRGREFPSEDRSFRILAVNRLVRRKRVDWILSALSHIPPEIRNRLEVRIAGDGPERYRLETMSRELNLQDRVRFLGEVDPSEMTALYLESDVFALPSEAEGLSNALLEAMSHGLPCLVAAPTGFSDIDHAVLQVDRHERIAQQIRLLMHRPEIYVEASAEVRRVAKEYTWEKAAMCYRDLIEQGVRG